MTIQRGFAYAAAGCIQQKQTPRQSQVSPLLEIFLPFQMNCQFVIDTIDTISRYSNVSILAIRMFSVINVEIDSILERESILE